MSISARDELANSYRNLSLLLWHANDTAGGLETGLKALSLREQLAAAKPADLDAQVSVVQSCRDIGQMFEEQGNFRKAMANLTRAKTLAETIAAAAPDRADYKGLLARVYLTTFYDMVQNAQDVEGALQMGQTTLRIYDKLSADHPAAFVYRQNKAVAFHFLGIGQLELSDLTAALQSFRNQLEVLGSPDPTNAWSRFAVFCRKLGIENPPPKT